MKSTLTQRSFMCNVNDAQMNTILVIVFLISFLLFKFMTSRNSLSKEEKERKSKKVEKYLNKYKQENEDFFMTSSDS